MENIGRFSARKINVPLDADTIEEAEYFTHHYLMILVKISPDKQTYQFDWRYKTSDDGYAGGPRRMISKLYGTWKCPVDSKAVEANLKLENLDDVMHTTVAADAPENTYCIGEFPEVFIKLNEIIQMLNYLREFEQRFPKGSENIVWTHYKWPSGWSFFKSYN